MKEQRNQRVKYLSLSLIGFIDIVPTISRGIQVSQLLVVSGFRGIKARRSCSSESEKLLLTKGAGVGLGEDGSRIAWRGLELVCAEVRERWVVSCDCRAEFREYRRIF